MPSETYNNDRDILLDNLKFILITLVVVGHFYERFIYQDVYFKAIFVCIYSFHMPLFVFISGYLSKSKKCLSGYKLVTTLLIPYLIFTSLWYIRESIHVKSLYIDLFVPTFHLWYLLALFNWRLLLPVIQSFKYYMPLSVIVALLVGLSPSVEGPLALSRTLALFPFFIMGTLCSSSTLHAIRKKKYLAVLGLIILVSLGYYVIVYNPKNWNIIFWGQPYNLAHYSKLWGLILRLGLLIAASLIGISLIILTPARNVFFSKMGSRTLTVYIFHGFVLPSFSWRFPTWHKSLFQDLIILLFPFILVNILSLPIIHKLYTFIINTANKLLVSSDANYKSNKGYE